MKKNEKVERYRKIKIKTVAKKYKDPCPCGSGKKYKQCCGKQVISTVCENLKAKKREKT